MATKNLARTVIEGGRTGMYKVEVAERNRQERHRCKEYLRDVEDYDEEPDPIRRPASIYQTDKLNPMYRFLDSKLGCNWSKVRSELFRKFDIRTTPGRHVLFDHLLRDVCEGPLPNPEGRYGYRFYRYYLDAQGRLCKAKSRWRKDSSRKSFNFEELAAWLGFKKVGRLSDTKLAWFVPTRHPERVKAIFDRGQLVYACVADNVVIRDPIKSMFHFQPKDAPRISTVPYRQERLLTEKEAAFFTALPFQRQQEVLSKAPLR